MHQNRKLYQICLNIALILLLLLKNAIFTVGVLVVPAQNLQYMLSNLVTFGILLVLMSATGLASNIGCYFIYSNSATTVGE